MGVKQKKTNYIKAVCNKYGILGSLAGACIAIFVSYILIHHDVLGAIEEATNSSMVFLLTILAAGVIAGVLLTAMIINSFRSRIYITDAINIIIEVLGVVTAVIYFAETFIETKTIAIKEVPLYVWIFMGVALLSIICQIVHSIIFDKTNTTFISYKKLDSDATFVTYYRELNRMMNFIITIGLGILLAVGVYYFDKKYGMPSILDQNIEKIVVIGSLGGLVLFYVLAVVVRIVNKRIGVVDILTLLALSAGITGTILYAVAITDSSIKKSYTWIMLAAFGTVLVVSILVSLILRFKTHITKREETTITQVQEATVSTEQIKTEASAEVEENIKEEELDDGIELEEIKEDEIQEGQTIQENEIEETNEETEDTIVSEEITKETPIIQEGENEEGEIDMALLQELIDAQNKQMEMLTARLEEQAKINASMNEKLDNMNKNIKLIADILGGLAVDTIPNAKSIQVSLDGEESAVTATPIEAATEEESMLEPVEDETIEPAEEETEGEEESTEKTENWVDTANDLVRIKPKMSFDMRLRVADDDIKKFYSDIRNKLLEYGVHDRISRHRENFNQGRINIARMVINGKTLKVYLAVDPETIDKRYFHQTDVGHRKGLVDLPTMINVRSKVSARKVMELIDLVMESLVISKKEYTPVNFAENLTLDGYTLAETRGYDYLVKNKIKLDDVKAYPDTFAQDLLGVVDDEDYQERFIKTTLSIDDLIANFEDGDTVDVDAVRQKGLGAPNTNYLMITESESLGKKFKVFANEYTPDAIKMITLAGGETYLVVQPEKVEEEA